MVFNSFNFIIFFPIVILIYFLVPKKIALVWLLVASYCFYMSWNVKYGIFLAFTTIVTYLSGIFIEKNSNMKTKKIIVALSCIVNLLLLVYFKYSNFIVRNLNRIFSFVGIQKSLGVYDILLPVGISFFIFQALSYTIDVYRGDIKAEKMF